MHVIGKPKMRTKGLIRKKMYIKDQNIGKALIKNDLQSDFSPSSSVYCVFRSLKPSLKPQKSIKNTSPAKASYCHS